MLSIVEVREGRFGKKVVASQRIGRNQEILRFGGVPVDFVETLELGDKESYGFQIGRDCYLYLDVPSRFFNHSCDPNCGVTPDLRLRALRDIGKDEELTYDYSTSMLERKWEMECHCGAETCRAKVSDFDTLPLTLRKRYLDLNVVQHYIVRSLRRNDDTF